MNKFDTIIKNATIEEKIDRKFQRRVESLLSQKKLQAFSDLFVEMGDDLVSNEGFDPEEVVKFFCNQVEELGENI